MDQFEIICNKKTLSIKDKTLIMGILNVTPDSFSDGGQYYEYNKAIDHALEMIETGADIIDIGGESTRPFADKISIEEELQRVIPIIESLSKIVNVPISIDTTKPEVAKQAIKAGATIINDISSLSNAEMIEVVKESGLPVILMHMQGNPKTMQIKPDYKNLINEIYIFLKKAVDKAVKNGISKNQIIIDPGIGFGKTVEDNMAIIKNLKYFQKLKLPVLIGPSRKSFIKKTLFDNSESNKQDLQDIEIGTQAAIAASILNGAHIVRVHDVFLAQITTKIIDSIKNAKSE